MKKHTSLNNPELKKNPFKVPDNYFEELPARAREEVGRSVQVTPLRALKPYLYAAAAIALFMLVWKTTFYFVGESQIQTVETKTEIGQTDYLAYQLADLSVHEIASMLEDEEMTNEPYPVDTTAREAIIDYLSAEGLSEMDFYD